MSVSCLSLTLHRRREIVVFGGIRPVVGPPSPGKRIATDHQIRALPNTWFFSSGVARESTGGGTEARTPGRIINCEFGDSMKVLVCVTGESTYTADDTP